MPVWTPFAHRYLDQGLQKITLYKREGESLLGDAPDFVSCNRWPAHAFEVVLAKGEIGEGGGWPVRAAQGGTFAEETGTPPPDKAGAVIAFLKLQPGFQMPAEWAYRANDACMFRLPVSGAPRRFDAIRMISKVEADPQKRIEDLTRSLGSGIDWGASRLAAYSHATDLT